MGTADVSQGPGMAGDDGRVLLYEVLPELARGEPGDLGPLLAAVADTDVHAGTFADEALVWAGPDVAGQPRAFVDAPRLATLTEAELDIALTTALWMLHASGELVTDDPDGQTYQVAGALSLVSRLREQPQAAFAGQVDVHGRPATQLAVYHVDDQLYLTELVHTVAGLHEFMFTSLDRQVGWLAATLDPLARASTDGPLRQADDPEALDPSVSELAEHAHMSGFVHGGFRVEAGGQRRTATLLATDDALHVIQGWQSDDGQVIEAQTLSPASLVEYCRLLLTQHDDS